MELGTIKTTIRVKQGKEQTLKLYSKKQRRMIIDYVNSEKENKGRTIGEVLIELGISPVVYHNWKRRLKNDKTIFEKRIEFKVIESGSVSELNRQISTLMSEGWKPVGSHQVVLKHVQNRFSGLQHKDSVSSVEYSQSMIKE